jgi:hypothetical protein
MRAARLQPPGKSVNHHSQKRKAFSLGRAGKVEGQGADAVVEIGKESLQILAPRPTPRSEARYRNGFYVIRLRARPTAGGGTILTTPSAEVHGSAPYRQALFRPGAIHFAIWDLRRSHVI